MRAIAIAVAVALCAAAPADAEPDTRRLGLFEIPPPLDEAIDVTLSAWGIELVAVSESAGATMPDAATRARTQAAELELDATVWISETDSGAALWIYDADSDRVVARPLPQRPPFDEPTAAAVALTIKTLLRHSKLAPIEERFGAQEALALRRPLPLPPLPEPAPLRTHWGFEAMAAVRFRDASSTSHLEPRVGIGLEVAPAFAGGWLAAFALFRAGGGVGVEAPSLSARFSDSTLSGGLRARVVAIGGFSLRAAAGASAHITELDGALIDDAAAVSANRVNPSIDLGLLARFAVTGGVSLDARLEAGVAGRRQRYTVAGEDALELPRAEIEAAVVLNVQAF
jgi:hypothetical protein